MCTENNSKCPYFGGGSFEGAVCRITDIRIEDISSVERIVCLCEHYYICSVYRNYNEDLVEV